MKKVILILVIVSSWILVYMFSSIERTLRVCPTRGIIVRSFSDNLPSAYFAMCDFRTEWIGFNN